MFVLNPLRFAKAYDITSSTGLVLTLHSKSCTSPYNVLFISYPALVELTDTSRVFPSRLATISLENWATNLCNIVILLLLPNSPNPNELSSSESCSNFSSRLSNRSGSKFLICDINSLLK